MSDFTSKLQVAEYLRASAEGNSFEASMGAIRGLGELGGTDAFNILSELIDTSPGVEGPNGGERWATLLEALGRAARYLPDRR